MRTGPRTNCKRAHGAATMVHGPFQRFVRRHFGDSGFDQRSTVEYAKSPIGSPTKSRIRIPLVNVDSGV